LLLVLLAAGCPDDELPPDGSILDGSTDTGVTAPNMPALPSLTPCPEGWREITVMDGPTVCEPWAEGVAPSCDESEARFVGEAGCSRVGSACPAGRFPEGVVATGSAIYVDGSAASGGDGSEGAPLSAIGDALSRATAGDVVVVSVGTYAGRFVVPPGVELRGACPAETTLTTPVAAPGLTGVVMPDGLDTRLTDVSIIDTEDVGVLVRSGTAMHLDGVVIAGARTGGVIAIDGGAVTAESIAVRRTRAFDDGGFGRGLQVEFGATAEVRRAVFEQNRGAGVSTAGADARITLEDVAIVGTLPEGGTREFGRGINAQDGATVELTRVLVEGNRDVGIYAIDGGSQHVFRDVVVRGTIAQQSDNTGGRAFEIDRSQASLDRVHLVENMEMGIYADDSNLMLEDIVIREVAPQPVDGDYGRGINLDRGTHEGRRLFLEACRDLGVVVWGDGATLSLEDIVVRDTRPMEATGVRGRALSALFGPDVSVVRGVFERSHELAVNAVGAGTSLDLVDVRITSVSEAACASTTCAEAPFGIGLGSYEEALITARSFVIEGAAFCGVHVAFGGGLDLMTGTVSGSAIGACVQDDGFDVSRLTGGVAYVDNGVNLDATTLPIPSTGSTATPR